MEKTPEKFWKRSSTQGSEVCTPHLKSFIDQKLLNMGGGKIIENETLALESSKVSNYYFHNITILKLEYFSVLKISHKIPWTTPLRRIRGVKHVPT